MVYPSSVRTLSAVFALNVEVAKPQVKEQTGQLLAFKLVGCLQTRRQQRFRN
jgi:hypothetical protein